MKEDRLFNASEVMMLMLDCGTSASQLFGQVPGFRLQAEFILSSKDDDSAKRLAFHTLLLNVASKILTDYCKMKDEQDEEKADPETDQPEQEDDGNGKATDG